jgi:hypothetical protein
MHSLLDVIKVFHCTKDYYEDNSPIVTADPRDELMVFGKTENFRPRFAIGELLQLDFPENIICIKFLFLK